MQYPKNIFTDESSCDILNQLLSHIGMASIASKWEYLLTDIEHNNKYINHNLLLTNVKNVLEDDMRGLHFNDILKGKPNKFRPAYTFSPYNTPVDWVKTNKFPKIRVGNKVNCVRCGKTPIELSEIMLCTDCELSYGNSTSEVFAYCEFCESKYIDDEGYYLGHEDMSICPNCMNNYVVKCDCCDNYYLEPLGRIHYNKEEQKYICDYCEIHL